jgi:hypothetical protein
VVSRKYGNADDSTFQSFHSSDLDKLSLLPIGRSMTRVLSATTLLGLLAVTGDIGHRGLESSRERLGSDSEDTDAESRYLFSSTRNKLQFEEIADFLCILVVM